MHPGCVPSRHLYQVLVANRDEVIVGLNRKDIFPGMHYVDNSTYRMYRSALGTCPNVARASREVMSLPMHLHLAPEDVRRIGKALGEVNAEPNAANR